MSGSRVPEPLQVEIILIPAELLIPISHHSGAVQQAGVPGPAGFLAPRDAFLTGSPFADSPSFSVLACRRSSVSRSAQSGRTLG